MTRSSPLPSSTALGQPGRALFLEPRRLAMGVRASLPCLGSIHMIECEKLSPMRA